MTAKQRPKGATRLPYHDYSPRPYHSWRQLAGYFDGDGAVYISVRIFVLKIRLCFYDVWKPQLEAIKRFLEEKGIPTRRLAAQHKKYGDVWYLTVSDPIHIKTVIRRMLPLSCKKRGDMLVALNYLNNKVTAEEAIVKLNELVRDKRRSGFIRNVGIPYTREDGIAVGQRFAAEGAAKSKTIDVPMTTQTLIRSERAKPGVTLREVSLRFGYSVHVIRRILSE